MSIIQQKYWRQVLQWKLSQYNWDLFGTGTFPEQRTETEAQTLTEHYFQDLEKRLQSPLPRFWVLEPHQYRATPHVHFLLAQVNKIEENTEKILWRYWRKHSGGGRFTSSEFDASRGGIGYLLKYLWKDVVIWDVANLDKVDVWHQDNSLLSEAEQREEIKNKLSEI